MKRLLVLFITLVFCMSGLVSCGKERMDYISFNGTTLSLPCKVQDVLNALSGVEVNEEELAVNVNPGETYYCNFFTNFGTSFQVCNVSDTVATVRDCEVNYITSGVANSQQGYEVIYPVKLEVGKEFNEKKVIKALGEPESSQTSSVGQTYIFYSNVEDIGTYIMFVTKNPEGIILSVSLTSPSSGTAE